MKNGNPNAEWEEIYSRYVVCDICFPEAPTQTPGLTEFHACMDRVVASGVTFVSFTMPVMYPSIEATIKSIAESRAVIRNHPDRYIFVESVDDILRAKTEKKLAVNFNFQETNPLLGDVNLVEVYYRLGVGHMLMAYNKKNLVGDGCHERTDAGLSRFGIRVIEEMNRVGMIVDATHTGYKTTMEMFEVSDSPVIFSHSNPKSLYEHDRNISDEQIMACAKTGGVVGITGVGQFLGGDVSTENLIRAIDYCVNLVGADHVGIGSDYVYDVEGLEAMLQFNKDHWPAGLGYGTTKQSYAGPEQISEIAEGLLRLCYSEADVRNILGENWLRIMRQVWKPRRPNET